MVPPMAWVAADGMVVVYPGDYDHFLVEREARQALLEARQRNQAKRVAEVERFIEPPVDQRSGRKEIHRRGQQRGRLLGPPRGRLRAARAGRGPAEHGTCQEGDTEQHAGTADRGHGGCWRVRRICRDFFL